MKKILVTGNAGFIGYHVVKSLTARDVEVVGLDVINDYYDVNLKYGRLADQGIEVDKIAYNVELRSKVNPRLEFIKLDLTDEKNINALFKKYGKEVVLTCMNDLLDYSREIHLELQELSVDKLLTQSIAMLTIPKDVDIQVNVLNQPTIEVDAGKIERVFINLIKNALDAMQNVGKISIDGKKVDSLLEISFTDTGMGISDEILPKLFLPLFTTKAQGMGFGLAICKRIVEAHGGTIGVKTAIGKGTTFIVSLPIKQPNRVRVGGDM